jgi:hypothetical protein
MPLSELATFFCVASVVRRVYNAYLEAVWFGCPEYRTQPPKEHQLKSGRKDLCGRELAQLQVLGWHNKMTMLTQFALSFGTYYALPGTRISGTHLVHPSGAPENTIYAMRSPAVQDAAKPSLKCTGPYRGLHRRC